MRYICHCFVLLLCWSAISGLAAVAGEYQDADGFKFIYPEGWVLVDPSGVLEQGEFPPQVRQWMEQNRAALVSLRVALLRNSGADFMENLNVVVQPGQIPASEETLAEMLVEHPAQFKQMGISVEDLNGKVATFAGRESIILDYAVKFPDQPDMLRQRQVHVPGGGNTYIITCTGQAQTFAQHEPTFASILQSVQAPPATAHKREGGGFDFSRIGIYAGIGALVGGLSVFFRRKQTTSSEE